MVDTNLDDTNEVVETSEDSSQEFTQAQKDNADFDAAIDAALDKQSERAQEKTEEKPTKEAVSTVATTETIQEEVEPPPAEFTAKGKEAWTKGDLKGIREEYKRLNASRTAEVSRAQNEYYNLKRMAQEVAPFIEAAGMNGKDPQRAITEAVALVTAINKDPKAAILQILSKKNLTPGDLGATESGATDERLPTVISKIEMLERRLEAEELNKVANSFGQVFESLAAEKNKAGTARFPDLRDDESGIKLAGEIGSLCKNESFKQAVRMRIPNAGLRELVTEAYKWLNAKVDDNEALHESPQKNNDHLRQAKRAAASVPGRAGGTAKGKRTYKDPDAAADAAMEELGY